MKNERQTMYVLLVGLIILWGTDYIFAKLALESLTPFSLLFFKYVSAALLVFIVKMKTDRGTIIHKKDIPAYFACVITGEIAYFHCEYTAMDYLPVSLISIIIAFVPVVSVITERILYKKKTSGKIILWIFVCIFGIVLIIGVDIELLLSGRLTGYLLAFACVFFWNAYNFITVSLHDYYNFFRLADIKGNYIAAADGGRSYRDICRVCSDKGKRQSGGQSR